MTVEHLIRSSGFADQLSVRGRDRRLCERGDHLGADCLLGLTAERAPGSRGESSGIGETRPA
jgi:hypothetical protein